MPPFDPNDYRKRVLAAIAKRGGPDLADAFELYDLPLDATGLTDAEVAARLDEVWGFWQRQRDHPKYRTLVARLVDEHEQRSAPLRSATSRAAEAARVRAERDERDAARYEILDTAITRLVERYGGVPAEKVAGLEEIGALGGLTAAEVAVRLLRHRVLPDATPAPDAVPGGLTAQRRAQIRALLTEWGELCGEPVPTLFALLGLTITDAHDGVEIRERADVLHRRAREMRPGRGRAVLDELGVHVREVLTVGGPLADAYARAVVADATEALRPKVRAAILIEDRLIGPDYEYLAGEGEELGLDRATAERVLAELAAEYGGGVGHAPPASTPARTTPPTATPAPAGGPRAWEAPLKSARAALRRGRPAEAARLAAEARTLDDGTAGTQLRTVADEAQRVLDEAAALWREVAAARAAGRYADASRALAQLQRRALDAPPPPGQPTLQEAIDEARRAQAGPGTAPHGPTSAPPTPAPPPTAAPATAPAPPTAVTAQQADGAVVITWSSQHPAADYKVSRQRPDGGWSVVGRTRDTRLEDGGAPRRAVPVYAVVAVVGGVPSAEARSDARPAPAPTPAPAPAPAPAATPPPAPSTPTPVAPRPAPSAPGLPVDFPAITNVAFTDGRVTFDWPPEVTEVYVTSRVGGAPRSPVDPTARSWKVTNTRYQIDGGAILPADLPRPAHVAVAACRRGPDGTLLLAPDFAPTAHLLLD
ncbi:hypothetical protein HWD35_03950 [Tsukamurella tyrosinosolvens]|uniref:hypothetical protein n=1 Tax=Tsukamurella tyrosinosolvens TaxID=57704 RepID=UPI000837FFFD|nr:hypothetical protein [Tsukamurella tyrosinosolvens]MCA4993858.1 hypothetical protein [Tsukamurella tyrosinosolvens]